LNFRPGDGDSSQKAKVDGKRQLSIFLNLLHFQHEINDDRLFLRIIFLSVDNIFNNRYFEYKFLHVVFVSTFFSLFFAFLPKNANQYYKKRKSLHLEWINCYFNFERNRIVLWNEDEVKVDFSLKRQLKGN